MVDNQSYYRTHSLDVTPVTCSVGVKKLRDLYHECGRKLFRTRHDRPVHDCRLELVKDHNDTKEFETWILSHGLTETFKALSNLNDKTSKFTCDSKKLKSLLYRLGKYGCVEGDFNYPRGISATANGDIFVADTKNNRIQHFTRFGVFVKAYGSFGQNEGQFNEPCDVTELPNGDVAVADSKNGRVQVFTDGFVYKYHFNLPGPCLPFSLARSTELSIVIAGTNKKLYIYDTEEKELKHHFPVGARSVSGFCPVFISVTPDSKVFVSDPEDNHIYIYSMDGQQLGRFRPENHTPGLAMSVGGLCVTPLGQVLIVDTLNHVICLYTCTGDFVQTILTPTDDVSNVHSLALGQEGHLIVTEFSLRGEHCIKVFRFQECPCHRGKNPPRKTSSSTDQRD